VAVLRLKRTGSRHCTRIQPGRPRRAITVSNYGASPSLTELPTPRAGSGQVLIAVQAAGMNPMDLQIADGACKDVMPATFPMVLGADLAGTVRDDGPGAARFTPGEVIFGQLLIPPLGSAGTCAQYVACNQDAPLARASSPAASGYRRRIPARPRRASPQQRRAAARRPRSRTVPPGRARRPSVPRRDHRPAAAMVSRLRATRGPPRRRFCGGPMTAAGVFDPFAAVPGHDDRGHGSRCDLPGASPGRESQASTPPPATGTPSSPSSPGSPYGPTAASRGGTTLAIQAPGLRATPRQPLCAARRPRRARRRISKVNGSRRRSRAR
jgi:Alcohol dehydrogenase GroES-like domain